jgi:hypothetical protein
MPTVRKYASAYQVLKTGWNNPQYATGSPDGQTAYHNPALPENWGRLKLYNFGFNLPVGAVVTGVKCGGWHQLVSLAGNYPYISYTFARSGASHQNSFATPLYPDPIGERSFDVLQDVWGPVNFNDDTQFWVEVAPAIGVGNSLGYIYLDAVFVEVTYTIPTAKKPIMDGFVYVE